MIYETESFLCLTGVGKTSLVQLILHGKPVSTPRRTVGCSVEVKVITCSPAKEENTVEKNKTK